jgi:2-haloacid dehalogenase
VPTVVVFDVNETLSDMRPLRARFADLGAPEGLATLWFTALLRDGFALAASGGEAPFARLADAALRTVLHGVELDRSTDDAVAHVVDGFAQLAVHPDVPDGVRALRRAGLRLVTLSNGSAQVAERLLGAAGLREEFEAVLSVEDAGAWKPARVSYEHAARTCGTGLGDMLMVAVHPWDLDGAARAGMATAWIDRTGAPWPDVFTPPTLTAAGLPELAERLAVDSRT